VPVPSGESGRRSTIGDGEGRAAANGGADSGLVDGPLECVDIGDRQPAHALGDLQDEAKAAISCLQAAWQPELRRLARY
jgi:hypothetical protein